MLKIRILSTLKFFDLQDLPVTLLELHKFLLADVGLLKNQINTQWELVGENLGVDVVGISEVARCLENECADVVEQKHGFYCLKGREVVIDQRLASYLYGIRREKLIRKYIKGLARVPFVRGVALAGSQAMGQQKEGSDIDLLIIVDPKFLWLARTGVTAYFQLLGRRRHGQKIANRFCLNHYLAGVKEIGELKNLYTAWEYAKLRPLVYTDTIVNFQMKNSDWIAVFMPNFATGWGGQPMAGPTSRIQKISERWLSGVFGLWLEQKLKNWQLPKIRQEEFILVREDELSFHPQSKQKELLGKFFIR